MKLLLTLLNLTVANQVGVQDADLFCYHNDDGLHQNVHDCSEAYLCWGDTADVIECADGTVYNQRAMVCEPAHCLPPDDHCYDAGNLTDEEIKLDCEYKTDQ